MRTIHAAKHDERRAQILAAAERCFARRGFHGASIAQICKEAKISPGHLYHYFGSKEEMITAIAESGLVYTQARVKQFTESKTDAVSATVSELENLRDAQRRAGPGVLLDILAEAARDPQVGGILQDASKGMRLLLATFFEEAQKRGDIDPDLDPQMSAAIFISLIDAGKALTVRYPDLDMDRFGKTMETMLRRFLSRQN